MDNEEYDTTLNLSEVWDILQGSDYNDRTTTSFAQLLNWAENHSNFSIVFFRLQDQLLSKDIIKIIYIPYKNT